MTQDIANKPNTAAASRTSSPTEITAFLNRIGSVPATERRLRKPRLLFTVDATGSRQETWDMATRLQGDMAAAAGDEGLEIALGYYRGYDECKITTTYYAKVGEVTSLMSKITTRSGGTQIDRLFTGFRQHAERPDGARVAVFIGDCFEEPENRDSIMAKAKELRARGFRVFIFQEGEDKTAAAAFKAIAEATGGIHSQFNQGSADELRDLMRSVAAYAAGKPSRPALAGASRNTIAFQQALAALPAPAL